MAANPYRYGLQVADLAAFAAALPALGFEPAAGTVAAWPEDGDCWLAFAHPVTGQELVVHGGLEGAGEWPHEGNTTVGIPVVGEPPAALAAMRAAAPALALSAPMELPREKGIAVVAGGQRLVLTARPEPFAIVHYSPANWPTAERFYESLLGFCYFPLPDRGALSRRLIENAGGRVELEVRAETPPNRGGARPGNVFRLLNAKLDVAAANLPAGRLGEWAAAPAGGAARVRGPFGERIELFERESAG